ncbi:MarR family winged helix-turn-helix transcriptional regulator [Methanobacterium sp.]|uniref:MarR family winged helix-turn-helix transcriptional regulator n=1 Tax=Methanobacterium sp. TaxID=2164 RepID=UPI002ABC5CEC|nr:MarR family winged helix-turn-helix transcriptional regulator [Methanobacterium sp.]MDY9922761.1 MarR family winged helix-turn-helix transcriptional regulator [Methanobacterium sp.]
MQNVKKMLKNDLDDVPLVVFISIIHRTHMIYLNHEIKGLEISAGQIQYIMGLSKKDGITQDDLASLYHIDKGSVARALKKLEDNKLICRKINPENRRKYLIYLTEKGRNIVPKIHRIYTQWENSICSELSKEQYNNLFDVLKTLAINSLENIDKNGENTK